MSKPIRIAIISPIFYSGGIPTTFLAIAEGLKDRGYEFHMINSFVDEFQDRFRKCGNCVYIHDNSEIIKYLQDNEIDIVQTNGFPRANYIAYVAGVPRIIERLSGMDWAFHYEKHPVSCIIASTDQGYKKAQYTYPHKYVVKIHNGIDLSNFTPHKKNIELINKLKIKKNEIVIGYCGRIAPEKCLDKLVNVFDRVIKSVQNTKLVLFGPPYKGCIESLKQQIETLHLSDHIIFIAPNEYPENIINIFDIGVITSGTYTLSNGETRIKKEGLSNSILEQMATAIPMVVTDSGENNFLIKNGYNGYLVGMEDMDSFYDRLMILIKDEHLRKKMGKNGRKNIEKHFNRKDMIDCYDNLYRYVISNEFSHKYPHPDHKMIHHYLGNRFAFSGNYEKQKNILVFRSGSKEITDSIIHNIEKQFHEPNTWLLCHEKSLPETQQYKKIKNTLVYGLSDSFDGTKMQDIVKTINQQNLDYLFFIFNDFMAKDENQNVVDIVNAIKADKKILVSKGNISFLWTE
ncbi:MAG: glycosyltransferase family 1 protein [Candidatus Auribacter fodinae]|jgi:glycosyltransferase involved in cell wall biosynthesis|uniref:Glycosyltransferase family 1 protein n=1 Tax=Candidatus Auribacter fodinae TaxID=2093366 RepID=A0A3A4R9T7_9BACT|nr:MAG: glycosyltransferase family 1 protein [Candidatus Auribacter fodinae]